MYSPPREQREERHTTLLNPFQRTSSKKDNDHDEDLIASLEAAVARAKEQNGCATDLGGVNIQGQSPPLQTLATGSADTHSSSPFSIVSYKIGNSPYDIVSLPASQAGSPLVPPEQQGLRKKPPRSAGATRDARSATITNHVPRGQSEWERANFPPPRRVSWRKGLEREAVDASQTHASGSRREDDETGDDEAAGLSDSA